MSSRATVAINPPLLQWALAESGYTLERVAETMPVKAPNFYLGGCSCRAEHYRAHLEHIAYGITPQCPHIHQRIFNVLPWNPLT